MLYTFPHELDYEVGRKIVQAVPGIDQVRFANSGSEATQAAIRLARAYTGKDKIMKWEGSYNGFLDCHAFSHVPALEAAGTEKFPRTLPSPGRHPQGGRGHRRHRALQRHRRGRGAHQAQPRRARLRARRAHPRRRRHHPAGARVPRGPAPHLRRERRGAHLRRDHHRLPRLARRRAGAVRRHPGHHLRGQGRRRRHAGRRRVRRQEGDHGARGRRRGAPRRHLQRQPDDAGRHERRARHPHQRPRARLRAPQHDRQRDGRRHARASSPRTACPRTSARSARCGRCSSATRSR